MVIYNIDGNEFFSLKKYPEANESFKKNIEYCKEPMNQLIGKYELKKKNILSIGSKLGHEEFWFFKNQCNLTLVDIDEHKDLTPYLEKIKLQNRSNLTYVIDDARNLKQYVSTKFHIVYFSSFTPNEIRNSKKIAKKHTSLKNRLSRKLNFQFLNNEWPEDTNPFDELTIEILKEFLEDQGLVVYQSYASGVDSRNQTYLKQIKNQLLEIGIEFIRIYYFEKLPAVHLILGYRGTKDESMKFLDKTKNNPEITIFHGRSKQSNVSSKIKIQDIIFD